MTALSVLVPDVRVEIPDIPVFVAERQLLRAAREFCEETRTWRVNVEISVVATVPASNIASSFPADTELVDVVSIKNVGGGAPVVGWTKTRRIGAARLTLMLTTTYWTATMLFASYRLPL